MMASAPATWQHGLVAEWWAEFNVEGPEIEYFGQFVDRGQPALDTGCGSSRLLLPWLRAGLDVDGCDASADMVALCCERAQRGGLEPTVFVQALHELDPPRRYRTIVVCGVFGLGSTRAQDGQALRRLYASLEPGGLLALDIEVPWANMRRWPRWTRADRERLPEPWPASGERSRAADGSEYEFGTRVLERSTRSTRRSSSRSGPRSSTTAASSPPRNTPSPCACTSRPSSCFSSNAPGLPTSTFAAITTTRSRHPTTTSSFISLDPELSQTR